MSTLNIGKDFSLDPAGRYYTDGDGSGEEFREQKLLPALKSLRPGEKLEIILDDGVEGYGSSFLVEGFAGVVKFGHYTQEELLQIIEIKHTDEDFAFYKNKIIEYITEAKYNSKTYTPSK
ncbi:STAS-like domain-containing protein [Ectopseudomonas oleovorans]|uniref:STAS-like domain-containing protein n=1 Tax=Ectopseudomonas oleovorans TaxID=301 RepID=UPI00244C3967|nr:STAS-like domain-containing protein [Pseudomonas oleovorans]MDG9979552.1 STAS-like domain-containing protein [Pseudomonas oleovorans]